MPKIKTYLEPPEAPGPKRTTCRNSGGAAMSSDDIRIIESSRDWHPDLWAALQPPTITEVLELQERLRIAQSGPSYRGKMLDIRDAAHDLALLRNRLGLYR